MGSFLSHLHRSDGGWIYNINILLTEERFCSYLYIDTELLLLFLNLETAKTSIRKEQAVNKFMLNGRGLFVLVLVHGRLAVTRVQISIEWFRLLYLTLINVYEHN